MSLLDSGKNPVKVAAGRRGGQTRWTTRAGEDRRVVRLDALTAAERRLVLALVAAAEAERARNNPETA